MISTFESVSAPLSTGPETRPKLACSAPSRLPIFAKHCRPPSAPEVRRHCGTLDTNFGSVTGTSNATFLVPFFDLKFLNGAAASRVGTLNRRHRDRLLSVGLGELVPHGDARNSVLGAFAVGAILLGSFLSGVIAARVLGVSASGTVLYVVWVVVLISPVVDVGLPSAAVRFVSEIRGQGRSDQAERLSRHLARVLAVPVLIASCAIVAILLLYGRVGRWPLRIGEPAGRFGFEALALLLAFFIA